MPMGAPGQPQLGQRVSPEGRSPENLRAYSSQNEGLAGAIRHSDPVAWARDPTSTRYSLELADQDGITT